VPPAGARLQPISPGEALFLTPISEDRPRGTAAPTRDNMPRTDEGRKGATDGRKESVNDRSGTRGRV
jgi:hypothetical protein